MSKFPSLEKPIQIGSLKLKHRMVMGPMWTRYCTVEGEVTDQMIETGTGFVTIEEIVNFMCLIATTTYSGGAGNKSPELSFHLYL